MHRNRRHARAARGDREGPHAPSRAHARQPGALRRSHHGRSGDAHARQEDRAAARARRVYDAAQAAFVEGKSFSATLAADKRVTDHLSRAEIDALIDPEAYTGLCDTMARDAAARARSAAREIVTR
ncbi:MAG TPA: hypothetical protein VHP37_17785 [Burkholderiales bacterium]|nr:hypothetical protein [Burkholderiales bacterium]